jgi:Fe-S cluster assembly protein SufD
MMGSKVYKSLFGQQLLEPSASKEEFRSLNDYFEYVTSNKFIDDLPNAYWSSILPEFKKTYEHNLLELKEDGLPTKRSEQFNFANIHKLYGIDILDYRDNTGWMEIERFSALANKKRSIVLNDSRIFTSEDFNKRSPFNVQILDSINTNKNRQSEYVKLLQQQDNFSKLSYALSPFPNVIIFPNGSKDTFNKNPVTVSYRNSSEEPVLECNTTIFDVQYNAKVHLNEDIKTSAGQMNYSMYILRENSELVIERTTNDYGGWNIFDSVFICHPGSKLTIKFTNTGSQYTQENFYIDSSYKTSVNIVGRNQIYKGNEYHQYVYQKSNDPDNYSSIDIKNVGKEYSSTSFIGRYDVGPLSTDFDGTMNNQNLMLDKNVTMHTRPVLDIHTKEIKCQHGCTVSNINEDHMYYLQTKGIDKVTASEMLIESFLC